MGQLFTIAFAVYGVIVLGIFIGIFGHAISEGQARTVHRLKTGRQRKLVKFLFQSTKNIKGANKTAKETQLRIRPSMLQDQISLLDDVWHVIKTEFPSILFVIVLAFILGIREGWSITSTAYFAIMSASTTGKLLACTCDWRFCFSSCFSHFLFNNYYHATVTIPPRRKLTSFTAFSFYPCPWPSLAKSWDALPVSTLVDAPDKRNNAFYNAV